MTDADLSRLLSHALRHEPWLYELELDPDGWVEVGQVIDAIRSQGGRWSEVTVDDVSRVLATAGKKRHEIVDGRIRALYGHSVHGLSPKATASPPELLYHGTAMSSWPGIREAGLLPMSRRYVHLSTDPTTAEQVGRRKSPDVIVVLVDAAAASKAGLPFYRGNDMVWLADTVPAEYLSVFEK